MPDELTTQISTDLGITDLPAEEQQKLIGQFGEVALKAVMVAIFEKLPEDKRAEFSKLAEAGDAAALTAFLSREVPNHETVAKEAVAEEVRRFREFQAT